jgi:hypothetical protein
MFPIATYTVSGTSTTTFTFSNIPQTFTHLELRVNGKSARTDLTNDSLYFRLNGDSGNNYTLHGFEGSGSAISVASVINVGVFIGYASGNAVTQTNMFSPNLLTFVDYTNTNKNKVVRTICGQDFNGSGNATEFTGMWINTAAITSISVIANIGSFISGMRADLYGISNSNATGV